MLPNKINPQGFNCHYRFRAIALLLFCAVSAWSQQREAALRNEAVAATVRKFDADLQRNGNGSYEAWVAKLAPLREYWQGRILHREEPKLWIGDFSSPDGFVTHGFRSVLGDITIRMDPSEPLHQIATLHQQLREKGIDLIFGIVPTSMEIYPEKYVDNQQLIPPDGIVAPYRRKFLHLLAQAGVEVVDLTEAIRAGKSLGEPDQLALRNDYHWSNLGVVLSAQAFAERLKRYDFVQKAEGEMKKYRSDPVMVKGSDQNVKVWPVTMPDGHLWEPVNDSPILVIGDSDTQVYGSLNPSKQWLPGSPDHADFAAQLSRFTGVRTSVIAVQGFTPDMLNREPVKTWEGRRAVIWAADGCHVLADLPWGDVRLKDPSRPEPTQTSLISPNPSTVLSADSPVVTFTWKAVPGAVNYWIDIGTQPGVADISYGLANGTSKTIDLGKYLNGNPVYFQVLAQFDRTLVRPPAAYKFQTRGKQH